MIGLTDFQKQWQTVGESALAAMRRVGESGWYVLGKEVSAFEAELAPHFGVAHAIGCASGLDALELALRALGCKPGDRVLTTPLTAFATTLAILKVGAVPVFAEVDASGLLDLQDAERRLTMPVQFVVPVHLFGHAMDLPALKAFSLRHGAKLIEDCAQAIGASFEGVPVGSVGAMAATSFYPTKNLGAFGDGGAVLTPDADLAKRVAALRDYGQSDKYVHDWLGLNSRLDELHAAVLRSALLPQLEAWTARRREIATRYVSALKQTALTVIAPPAGSTSVWHLFPVLVHGDREVFRRTLHDQGIGSGLHYPKLTCEQRAYRDAGLHVPMLPRALALANGEVSLPLHPFMSDDEVDQVISACNKWSG